MKKVCFAFKIPQVTRYLRGFTDKSIFHDKIFSMCSSMNGDGTFLNESFNNMTFMTFLRANCPKILLREMLPSTFFLNLNWFTPAT